ncbi:MAG: AMP-binding protein [Gemmatimonadota bacterium]
MWELLEHAAARWPEAPALTSNEELWSFADLREAACAAADRLSSLGIGRGDKVAVWAANVPEWIFLEFGLPRLGAVLVTANTALGVDDLTYLLRDSDAKALVVGREVKGNDLRAILSGVDRRALPRLKHVVLAEEREVGSEGDTDPALSGVSPDPVPARPATGPLSDAVVYEDLPIATPHVPPAEVRLDDLINMQYTSGTTGFPKGVMLSSRNIVNNGWAIGRELGLGPEDRVLCQVPLFHCFGCVIAVLGAYTHGASVHLTRTFDPLESLRTIDRRKITTIYGVPTMFQALLDHAESDRFRVESLRTGMMAGAVCPPSLMRRLIDRWGVREMAVGYGLTETSPAVTITPRSDPPEERCGTVGVELPGVEVRLVDPDTGEDGERGELWVRGELVMLGYYGNPEATAETITPEGWLRSGDLAERLPGGRYRIVGRLKEMILRGGENVYPAEVEQAIRRHPQVAEVAVFGIPDERLGEQVACAIVPRPGAGLTAAELDAFLRERIARTKIPRRIEFVDALPLTASGKVQRYVLTERFGQVV